MVLTLSSVPRIASRTDTSVSVIASLPSRLNWGLLLTLTWIIRSPPRLPLPLNFKCAPLSMPLGNLIYSWALPVSTPLPEQLLQGVPMIWPEPWHRSHSILIIMMPWWKVIKPVPWQLLHFCGLDPGFALVPLQVPQVDFFLYSMV